MVCYFCDICKTVCSRGNNISSRIIKYDDKLSFVIFEERKKTKKPRRSVSHISASILEI